MCGIVGVMAPGAVDHGRLDAALSVLEARGPDGSGTWWSADSTVGLGHTRLAINDTLGGRQPHTGGDRDRYVVTVNGEFYGLDTQGRSDSHMLPELYQRYGLDKTLEMLRGEFAFLLYDRVERQLIAVRDRFGIKPLFWARRDEETWFASKPSALWAAGVEAGWCEWSFLHAAATQYSTPQSSLFRGVNSVHPGCYSVEDGKTGVTARYWKPPTEFPRDSLSSSEFADKLAECVSLRLPKDQSAAVLLSGGVDSASIASLASESEHLTKVYTIDFPEARTSMFSEARGAEEQARFSGLEHQIIPLTSADIVSELPEMVRLTEGLCVNGHGVAKLRLARAVRQDRIKVLLSGEGADELLCGYRHFAPYFGAETSLDDPAGL